MKIQLYVCVKIIMYLSICSAVAPAPPSSGRGNIFCLVMVYPRFKVYYHRSSSKTAIVDPSSKTAITHIVPIPQLGKTHTKSVFSGRAHTRGGGG